MQNDKEQEKKKDFIDVINMSRGYAAWREESNVGGLDFLSRPNETSRQLHFWQVEAQLAIAQQLTIIAKHLGKIVESK